MKISNNLRLYSQNISFGRALTGREEKEFQRVTNEAMEALNVKDGMRVFSVLQTSLPSKESENTGVGKLNSKEALDYLRFMSLYTGSNAVKIYPMGQMPTILRAKNYFCPYERTTTSLGEDNINFSKLTTSDYGNILTDSDLEPFISDKQGVDFENELDRKQGAASVLIKKAYENLKTSQTPGAQKLKEEFEEFKKSQKSDTLDRLAIAPIARVSDPDLFENFEQDAAKQFKFQMYKHLFPKVIETFKFGKFLAQKNLREAKAELNKDGLELFGDIPTGFSKDEVFCFPDAFYPKNVSSGWGFRAIKYKEIPQEGTSANRLMKEKISTQLENLDGMRFDVGWQYFKPRLVFQDGESRREEYIDDMGDTLFKFIEKTAKEVKGENWDTKKLFYEPGVDMVFDFRNGVKPQKIIEGKTPITVSIDESESWGNPQFYESIGLKDYIIGPNNHDSSPLGMLAEGRSDDKGNLGVEDLNVRKSSNIAALSKALRVDYDWLKDPKNFITAKFAELFQAKNHFVFFNDVTTNPERIAREGCAPENYRYRISNGYESEYHERLQEGRGFNLPESLALAMKAKDLDKENTRLYSDLLNFAEILKEKGATTKEEAEKINQYPI